MNNHVQTMKNAISNFQKAAKAAAAKMEENNRLYKPEEAERANAAIMAKLKEEQDNAKRIVADARAAGHNAAEAWGQLDGSRITDDAKLLEHGAVTPEQFRGLVQKYQDNATMLQLLANYAEEKNQGAGGFSAVWNYGGKGPAARTSGTYDTSGLPSVKGKSAAYDRYGAQASGIIDRIGNLAPGRIGEGPENPFVLSSVEQFGADAEF